jgi:hypothetical protein
MQILHPTDRQKMHSGRPECIFFIQANRQILPPGLCAEIAFWPERKICTLASVQKLHPGLALLTACDTIFLWIILKQFTLQKRRLITA